MGSGPVNAAAPISSGNGLLESSKVPDTISAWQYNLLSIEGTCDREHTYVHMGYGARLLELMLRACMGNLVRGRSFVCIGFPRFCFSWTKEKVLKGVG